MDEKMMCLVGIIAMLGLFCAMLLIVSNDNASGGARAMINTIPEPLCEFEFSGKGGGFVKGLFNATVENLASNAPLNISNFELHEIDGNLEFSAKAKFPCWLLEEIAMDALYSQFYNG